MNKNINVNMRLLSDRTRIWLYNATSDEIARIVEIGFMVNYESNKESMNMGLIMNKTIENVNEIGEIKRMMNELTETKIPNIMTTLMNEKNNGKSSELGKDGELEAYNILNNHFDSVIDMHDKAHNGDYVVNDKVLIEVKNYTRTVPTKEVEKFKKDLSSTGKLGGVFWSLNVPIANMGDMKHTMHIINGKEIPVIYINTKSKEVITMAIEMILIEIKSKEMINITNEKEEQKMNEKLMMKMDIIKGRMNELEQNMKTIITLRNMVKKMSEQFTNSIENILMEITTLEGTSKTNITIINQQLV